MIKNGVWSVCALLALSLAASAGGPDSKDAPAKPAARPGVKADLPPGDVKNPGDVARIAAKNSRVAAATCDAGAGGVCHVRINVEEACKQPKPEFDLYGVKPGVTVFWTLTGSPRWEFDQARGIAFKDPNAPVRGRLVSGKVWRGDVAASPPPGFYAYGIHVKHADGRTCDVDPILWV